MSRSDYSDGECSGWDLIRWRGAVKSAIRGKRGQKFFKELLAAMDAMQNKILVANELETSSGEFCTLGVLGCARGIEMQEIDPEDHETVAKVFNVSDALVREVVFMNDDGGHYYGETPEDRWLRMRKWVVENINNDAAVS